MPPINYRDFYGIGLLDDLHNYFPALLYAPENFVSVRDVLLYIRTRTSEELNLFSMAQRDYNNTRIRQTNYHNSTTSFHNNIHNTNTNANMHTNTRPRQSTSYRYNTSRTQQPNVRVSQTTIPVNDDSSISMLASLFTLFTGDNVLDNLEPVVVRPSHDILASNTEVYIAGEDRCNCAVCLEMPAVGAEMRKIRGCGHSFHRRCIDIWFQRNVHCPVCRHDVRENTTQSSTT